MDKKRGLTLSIEDSFRDAATAATSEKSVKRPSNRSISLSKRPSPRHARHTPYTGPSLPVEANPKPPMQSQTTKNVAGNCSTDTLCEDPNISHEFNSRAMLTSFAHTFDVNKVMKQIFPMRHRQTSTRTALKPVLSPKSLVDAQKKELIGETDSLFTREEADLILSETMRKPRAAKSSKWELFMKTMKEKPQMMMNLVPLRISSPKAPRRLSMKRSSFTPRGLTLTSPTSHLRQASPSLIPRIRRLSTPQYSTAASMTEEEVESLRTKTDDNLTEDWSKSILYQLVKMGKGGFNEAGDEGMFMEEELGAWGVGDEDIPVCYHKALRTLEQLLVEMLGTREDAERFHEKYSKCSMRSVKHLITKCQELLQLRTQLIRMLNLVRLRERCFRSLMKEAETSILKVKIVDLFRQGKQIEIQIEEWMHLDPPFSCFVFRGMNYLDKIVEQNLEAVLLLAKLVI